MPPRTSTHPNPYSPNRTRTLRHVARSASRVDLTSYASILVGLPFVSLGSNKDKSGMNGTPSCQKALEVPWSEKVRYSLRTSRALTRRSFEGNSLAPESVSSEQNFRHQKLYHCRLGPIIVIVVPTVYSTGLVFTDDNTKRMDQ